MLGTTADPKTRILILLSSTPRISDALDLGWSLRLYFPGRFPGATVDADPAGLGTTLGLHWAVIKRMKSRE